MLGDNVFYNPQYRGSIRSAGVLLAESSNQTALVSFRLTETESIVREIHISLIERMSHFKYAPNGCCFAGECPNKRRL